MEIFTGREGEIVLKKYSPVGEMGEFARIFAELLAQNLGMLVGISDHDQFIAASGPEHRLLLGKSISGEMEETIRNRSLAFVEKGCRLTENGEEMCIRDRIDMISALCLLMARGALISMVAVLLFLPAMFWLFDGLICKTSRNFCLLYTSRCV